MMNHDVEYLFSVAGEYLLYFAFFLINNLIPFFYTNYEPEYYIDFQIFFLIFLRIISSSCPWAACLKSDTNTKLQHIDRVYS